MKPKYLIENKYSIYSVKQPSYVSAEYIVEKPENRFERSIFRQYNEAKTYLYREEYSLALNAFAEIRQLILKTVNPKLPPHPKSPSRNADFLADLKILDPLFTKTGEILQATPTEEYHLPENIFNDKTIIPASISNKINDVMFEGELKTVSYHDDVSSLIDKVNLAAENNNWEVAVANLNKAIRITPASDKLLMGSLLHDIAVVQEKSNKKDEAEENLKKSADAFKSGKSFESQASALHSLAALQSRSGKTEEAKQTIKAKNQLIRNRNLHNVDFSNTARINTTIDNPGHSRVINPRLNNPRLNSGRTISGRINPTHANTVDDAELESSVLFGKKYLNNEKSKVEKKVFIAGDTQNITLAVNANVKANLNNIYSQRVESNNFEFLTAFLYNPIQMVAYLPHMYFFVLPMAIGDCYHGMGRFSSAEQMYLNILKYPFINKKTEIVNLWIRIAENILEQADIAYKRALDNHNNFDTAKKLYEQIVRTNGSLLAGSPLYKDSKFAGIKSRVSNFLNPFLPDFNSAFGSSNVTENPRIISNVLEAKNKLIQIKNKLNFFGFSSDYLPPFTFEYLQTTAKYFAQQASQIESKYIQFKSTAENEDLRLDQMDQQVEVAEQSVELEERGVAEAQTGIDVAQQTLEYAETRKQNAKEARDNFNDVKWELLELEEATAWASASAVDRDDQVKLSWDGHYYNSNKKRRNVVLKELTYQKTRINQDLQADNLQNAFEDATAYVDVAKAQKDQAAARKIVAEQRLEIAKIQKRHAEENREFLQLKEFGASQWYRMAKLMKRVSRRYLDKAIEIAMLAQRAYHAETERKIRPIRYDYVTGRPGGLLGADQLLQNIDHFTYDKITNIHTKKAPVKQTISLSDKRPFEFSQLLNKGVCKFHTTLQDFDRAFPGLYQCKIKNVELVIVGITSATSIAGSLRNVGVSKFRKSNGSVSKRLYSADIMPLSQYSFRNDALAFRFDPKDLKLFENHGVATLWELNIRPDANDFNLKDILDVHLVIYYDGFYSSTLEQQIIANLPASANGAKTLPLRLLFPDELFYLRNRGEAIVDITKDMFAASETNIARKNNRMIIRGDDGFIDNLTVRIQSTELNDEIVATTDDEGNLPSNIFSGWNNNSIFDKWTLTILSADNQGKLVDGNLPLHLLEDVFIPLNYSFDYRKF